MRLREQRGVKGSATQRERVPGGQRKAPGAGDEGPPRLGSSGLRPQALLRKCAPPAPRRRDRRLRLLPPQTRAPLRRLQGLLGKTGAAARRRHGQSVSHLDVCAASRAEDGAPLPMPEETPGDRGQGRGGGRETSGERVQSPPLRFLSFLGLPACTVLVPQPRLEPAPRAGTGNTLDPRRSPLPQGPDF